MCDGVVCWSRLVGKVELVASGCKLDLLYLVPGESQEAMRQVEDDAVKALFDSTKFADFTASLMEGAK